MSRRGYLVEIYQHRNSSEEEVLAKRPGLNLGWYAACVEMTAANLSRTKAESTGLMEVVCKRGNLMKAMSEWSGTKGRQVSMASVSMSSRRTCNNTGHRSKAA